LAIVEDDIGLWPDQGHLASFLQSMKENSFQLKEIDICLLDPESCLGLLTFIKILECIPSLQRLYMVWGRVTDLIRPTYNKTILFIHDTLKFEDDLYNDYTLQYIQNMLYALQSFSTDLGNYHFYRFTLDFKGNAKLGPYQYRRNCYQNHPE
jgi:hypothetical protein